MKTYFLHPESIQNLFGNIAPTYDLLNHLLSLGRDFYWRRRAVEELKGLEGRILDMATGTGDVAIEILRQNDHQRRVFGLAFSEMVRVIKKDGKVIILEFTFPKNGWMRRLYPIYFQRILPRVGGFISGDRGASPYLPESVFNFASAEKYEKIIENQSFPKSPYDWTTFLNLHALYPETFLVYVNPSTPNPEASGSASARAQA